MTQNVKIRRRPYLALTSFACLVHSVLFLGKKDREKNSPFQIGRWTGTDCVRGAALRWAERTAGEEMISSLAFFSLPTPPSDLSTARVCVCLAVTFLRNAHAWSFSWYLEHSRSSRRISTLAHSKKCAPTCSQKFRTSNLTKDNIRKLSNVNWIIKTFL